MMKKITKKLKGFTLIELIVVIAIIGVLAAILIPTMIGYVRKSKRASDVSQAKDIHTNAVSLILEDDDALESFYSQGASYATPVAKMDQRMGATYDLVPVAYLDGAGGTDGNAAVWTPVDSGQQGFCDALNEKYNFSASDPKTKIRIKSSSGANHLNRWFIGYRKGNDSTIEIWTGDGSSSPGETIQCLYVQITLGNT